MTVRHTWTETRGVEALTALLGEPAEAARRKARTSLSDVDVGWLQSSPFCVIATASPPVGCDASPKGDPAGHLVHVIDERTIALAGRPGNRRADGYRSISREPLRRAAAPDPRTWGHPAHQRPGPPGLRGVLLRPDGRRGPPPGAGRRGRDRDRGAVPSLLQGVPALHLWDPSPWEPEARVLRRAVLAQQPERPENTVAELDEYYGPSYAADICCTSGA